MRAFSAPPSGDTVSFWSGLIAAGCGGLVLFVALPLALSSPFPSAKDRAWIVEDRPVRTAIGVGAIAFYTVLGLAGSDDVISVAFGLSVNAVVWFFRIALFVVPLVVGAITFKLCKELQARDADEDADLAGAAAA